MIRAFTGEPYMMHQVEKLDLSMISSETISAAVNLASPQVRACSDKDRYDGIRLYANHNYAVPGAGYDENTENLISYCEILGDNLSLIITDVRTVRDDVYSKITMGDFSKYFLTYSVVTEGRGRRGR